jgi:hypothetical protein
MAGERVSLGQQVATVKALPSVIPVLLLLGSDEVIE